MYLEYYRGTYTTQRRTKRANRKAECALHDAEFLASLASLLDPDFAYPAETFTRAWRLVCLNQFHDIIPGSSIGPVYVDSLAQYAETIELTEGARDSALACLAAKMGGDWLLVNPTSFTRSDVVFLLGENNTGLERDGAPLAIHPVEGGVLVAAGELPPYSVIPINRSAIIPAPKSPQLAENCLENDFLRVEFSPVGDIIRIFDKANAREVLPPGEIANQFQAFEDRPKFWDAWDIDIFYDDKLWLAEPATSMQLIESGPPRWTMEIKRRILNSSYIQRISLTHNSARLNFDTHIDWRERHILLKVAFPVEILALQATYETHGATSPAPRTAIPVGTGRDSKPAPTNGPICPKTAMASAC